MITTIEPVLQKISFKLNEGSTDTTAKRISAATDGVRQLLTEAKFNWAKKTYTLTTQSGIQEYNLETLISDYNQLWGLDSVWVGGKKFTPLSADQKSQVASSAVYLSEDAKSLGFFDNIDGTESVEIVYFATFETPANSTATLNISIPEDALEAIALAAKAVIHDGKRQRFDARNALIDYQAAKEKVVMQNASNKMRDLPKRVTPLMAYNRFQRQYPV
jgi:hypothetical protein